MTTSRFERSVYLMYLGFDTVPADAAGANELTVLDLLSWIKEEYEADRAKLCINPRTRALADYDANSQLDPIYISKISETEDHIAMLLNLGDTQATDPTFLHRAEPAVRTVSPEEDETLGYSAHLIVSKTPEGDGRLRAGLEKVSNLSRTTIDRFLNRLLKLHQEQRGLEFEFETYNENNGQMEPKSYRPKLTIFARTGATLADDIRTGSVSSIKLIERSLDEELYDTEHRIRSVERTLSIKIAPTNDWEHIRSVCGWAQAVHPDTYDLMQIYIRNLPGNKSASPRFEIEQEDAAQLLYSRVELLDEFENELKQCVVELNEEICTKILQLLGDNTKW